MFLCIIYKDIYAPFSFLFHFCMEYEVGGSNHPYVDAIGEWFMPFVNGILF
jgi:hypothetical protein